jgi:hypothetical protein
MDKKRMENKQSKELKKKSEDDLYGIDTETSLQSVNFATTENPYLNQHFQEEPND